MEVVSIEFSCHFSFWSLIRSAVINPAERNAIVGIKPTVGLTSRAG